MWGTNPTAIKKKNGNTPSMKHLPLLALGLLAGAHSFAASADALLELLVEKGVVTEEEAAQLEKEAEKKDRATGAAAETPETDGEARTAGKQEGLPPEIKDEPGMPDDARVTVTSSSRNLGNLRLRGRIQTQFGAVRAENDNGTGDHTTLEMRRVRLGMQGTLFQNVRARVETNLLPANDFSLRSGYLQWREHEEAFVKVGFDKPTFGFEENTSSASILTVERSLITDTTTPGTTTGVTVDGEFDTFGYSTGLYTDRDNENQFDSGRYLFGVSGHAKLDPLLPRDQKLQLRADFLKSNDSGADANFGSDFEEGVSASAHYNAHPFDFRTEFIYATGRDAGDTYGWYVMPSLYLTEKFQLVGRFETADSDDARGLEARSRYTRRVDDDLFRSGRDGDQFGDDYWATYFGGNYYFSGDDHKIMLGLEYSELDTDTAGTLEAATLFGAWRMLF